MMMMIRMMFMIIKLAADGQHLVGIVLALAGLAIGYIPVVESL